ncbi:probable ubiquitin carboxyl-terminal hydrolase FAF-X isoform X2 [Mizuhopecten yessoensis]|uniref:ubiquitinyl hydrolase 1 n=1 Tax=Mizuhopecten yessoensis TaxID=6573 RepID=A0A210PWP4_MIZYE|nr:probable ubiquitin carboxyl-terminal hydrolase FAF-X isoform X2 [Mizuhopecten yessoensis]OWF40886.1 ubiquitin carboxyl-terminal hydrolase FAF-X [Mizuhopecten yessoensis]
MTIVMRGSPAGGDSPQDNTQQQQQPQGGGQPPHAGQAGQAGQAGTAAQPPQQPPQPSGSAQQPQQPSPGQSSTSTDVDGSQDDTTMVAVDLVEGQVPDFPLQELSRLDEMINRPRWVVPVLPKGELEVLLDAAIKLCKEKLDTRSEHCQRFFREGLNTSFTKIMTDEAVSGWKYEIHRCILKNAEKMIELSVSKLTDDWFPLLELLAMVLNPVCKFHTYNGTRPSDSVPANTTVADDVLYARPPDPRTPRGWLVDLVNKFGTMEGFSILLERFTGGPQLSVPVIAALIKPFGQCAEVLTPHCVEKYFMPIVAVVPKFLDSLTDEELKKESKTEAKNDALSSIIKALKQLVYRLPNQDEKIKALETFRLKMILRLLKISSFNGKMNALNEVNKVIANVSFQSSRHSQVDEDEWLTAEKMAEWIQNNHVLTIVLGDSLHQPQYVEKLEKILRFMIKEKALTGSDLDTLWEAQSGKHDAIVKNVHDLLAKLAWDFSPEQLDHLFEAFQGSWAQASKKQREKLLELIRRLAEDDKEGVMAHKVLGLLWNLAHSEDVPTEIMDQALNAHIKILDYSCSQDRDTQKMTWITKFVEELKNDKWVLPSLKQIREICQLFPETNGSPTQAPQNFPHPPQRTPHVYYRNMVISQLQSNHSIVMLLAQNLSSYMTKARAYAKEFPESDSANILPDGRFNHILQIQERLRFLRFLLKDGQLWLCESQARQIWQCLAENAIYTTDRESCFKWFAKLMGEEPDLDPEITRDFFEQNILQLDPSLLTENGMNCFERFFKNVNVKESKLIAKRRGGHMMDDMELIGLDYMWRVVLLSPDEVSNKAITLLKDIFTNLGPRLLQNQVEIHEDFIQSCIDRLKAIYDTVSVLEKDKDSTNRVMQETTRMVRVLTVLKEYVGECDEAYNEERTILPLSRACRGRLVSLILRFPSQGRQPDDLDIWSHTNDTVGAIRRQVLTRVKAASNIKVDLYANGEILDPAEDKRLISQVPLRDKTLISAKLVQVGNNMPSSPDSSSDSSAGSPHHTFDGPNVEAENCLPGVLISNSFKYTQFLFQLSDLGCQLQVPKLRDTARILLKIMPADTHTVDKLRSICAENTRSETSLSQQLELMFFNSSTTQTLYNIEVCYSLLMPAGEPLSEDAFDFQFNFVKSGGVQLALNMLTKNNFMPAADLHSKRNVYVTVMKVCKLMLTTVSHAKFQVVVDACNADPQSPNITAAEHNHAVILQQALQYIPNPTSEFTTKNVAMRLGQQLLDQATKTIPDLATIKAIQKIAWASSSSSLHLVHATNEEIHKAHEKPKDHTDFDDLTVAREALEVLTVCLALCPPALDALNKDKAWQIFIKDLLLLCSHSHVRVAGAEQFYLMATRCCGGTRPMVFFITLLFCELNESVKENAKQAHEYFSLLCKLLNYACASDVRLPNAEKLLSNEIDWLIKTRDDVVNTGEVVVEEALLGGHLGITRELLAFQSSEKKCNIGSEKGGANLIKEIVEDFLFPASKIVLQSRKLNGEFPSDQAVPVCSASSTVIAAFELLVALCTNCLPNLRCLAGMLTEMFYNGEQPLNEWEYLPPVGPRPIKGFVGLKNAGATCYMNSVLQQLFMIEQIRTGILAVEGVADDIEEEYVGDEKSESETNVDMGDEERKDEEKSVSNKDEARKEYHQGVLKQIQLIFGHLATSKLQYYVPRGFWKHFRLWGEPVNLREQHDALEFFNSLVDSLDESLKALGQPTILSKVMGGSFADQKICKDCPHRYQREEPFTTLNVDIRNHQNLLESLEQYVKGDLLEGANAYKCEKCNKKVDTVKRLVIKKLPKVLAIQLKRFDYDWERESAIKFNDYFEFPREIDMEPYTVQGLAKIEGEIIDDDFDTKPQSTKYKLFGVVVHSGQASGGHYYSYVLHRGEDNQVKWYKFDDGDVSECKMEDDEEIKNQCFGGEYLGEVFDHMLKRMAYRRQKRWWNAYILFYERQDETEDEKHIYKSLQDLTIANKPSQVKMPGTIEKCVRKQNIMFMHEKSQFCPEYFQFMKKLLTCNPMYHCADKVNADAENVAMISTELAAKFLFHVGFHTKKTLRGPANEWYEALSCHLRPSKKVRTWFAQHVLFAHPNRFAEYLLECPTSEVRTAFCKTVVCLSHFALRDGPCPPPLVQGLYAGHPADPNATLSDHLLLAVLHLLKKEVSEHGRHLQQYFHLFLMYANLGQDEKMQLLKLNVPSMFMLVALDEGPGPPIKYQYAELSRLYSVVSILIRCCDVSTRCLSSNGEPAKANPHGDSSVQNSLMPIQSQVSDILYGRTSYVKKLIEDCNNTEDTTKLLRFCCWENPHFSSTVLSELLWQVAYSYTYELRPYLDLLLQMLLLEDSWQNHRIHNALKGIPDDRDGLFDTIQRSKNHYQKRAYQCIKMMVSLFTLCRPAAEMLQTNGDLKRKWTWAVEWLNDELERRPYPGNTQYTYNNWSPPAQSNETSNGYFLERSHSARETLSKAFELCPEEEPEDGYLTDEQETPATEDAVPPTYPPGQTQPPTTTSPPTSASQTQPPTQPASQPPTQPPASQTPTQPPASQPPSQTPVQNNQVNVSHVSPQPIHPSNQINNQLNQQTSPATPAPTTGGQSDNPDTGEEEVDNGNKKTTPE